MILNGRRIRSLSGRLGAIAEGAEIIISLTEPERFGDQLELLGFSDEAEDGETILPPKAFGPSSTYNYRL